VFLRFGLKIQNRLSADKSCTDLFWFGWIFIGTPLNLRNITFANKRLVHCVTLVVTYGQKSVLRGSNKVALFAPVSLGYFFAVLRNAGYFSICFAVEENNRTLFRSDGKHRVSYGPSNKGSFIFSARKLNFLERSLAH